MTTRDGAQTAGMLAQARRQDEDAVVSLIERCASRIVAAIEAAGVPRYAADFDDAQNQALFEIWKQFPKQRKSDAVCSWMHGIARRITASRIIDPAVRHRKRAERYGSVRPTDVSQTAGHAEQFADRDLLGRVLQELSDDHREVLVLRYLEGRSEQETATILGIAAKTVSSRTSRAKRSAMDIVNALDEVAS